LSQAEQETKMIFCNCCRNGTHHVLRARYSRPRKVFLDEDGNGIDNEIVAVTNSSDYKVIDVAEIRTSIWSCNGCDEETFEYQYIDADPGGTFGNTYHPPRSAASSADGTLVDILQNKRFQKLDPKLNRLCDEVIKCFNADCLLLCSVGLRALIEGICKEKGVTNGNLEHKVDGLIKFLPNVNLIEALHTFRFAGNSAAHELEPSSRDDAKAAIGIMEHLLNYFYDLDYKASLVRNASRGAFKSDKLASVQ